MICEPHEVQDKVSDQVDSFETAILGLTEAVSQNSETLEQHRQILDLHTEMLLAIVEHLDVPCQKPPMGFNTD